jgi:hypothetical protein
MSCSLNVMAVTSCDAAITKDRLFLDRYCFFIKLTIASTSLSLIGKDGSV